MPYSAVGDLLTGSIPLPRQLDPEKFIADAADEIDSKIGFTYVTPLDMTDDGPLARPVRLMIKRISNMLASGRLILAVASPGEGDQLHAYGLSLVFEATAALEMIRNGEVLLEGGTVIEGEVEPTDGPLINNKDLESNVDAFYDRIANSEYSGQSIFSPVRSVW